MQIENVKAKLPVDALTEIMLGEGFSHGDIKVGMEEYCRLLVLLRSNREPLRPTKLGDEVLHLHLKMARFDHDCLDILGAKLNHYASDRESVELTAMWQRTRELTIATFGIDPLTGGNRHVSDKSHPVVNEQAAPCHVTLEQAAPCHVTLEQAAPCHVTLEQAAPCHVTLEQAA
ncbi:hypothetical protein [Skermanella pratensis]|uniref:hypothetical protein n=1 Tax=Skermanella pratensis TaxID=2233999 RepID=UPI0013016931|nr:hypothetical protein [Skermanella pratensis]